MMGYGNGYGNVYGNDGGYGYSMMGGGWLAMWLWILLGTVVLIGIVLLILWTIRMSHNGGMHPSSGSKLGEHGHHEAVVMAKKRFARGEISKEQYEEIMHTLGE